MIKPKERETIIQSLKIGVEPTVVGEIIAQQGESQNNTDDDAFASFRL